MALLMSGSKIMTVVFLFWWAFDGLRFSFLSSVG
jgi:hypothetical protein